MLEWKFEPFFSQQTSICNWINCLVNTNLISFHQKIINKGKVCSSSSRYFPFFLFCFRCCCNDETLIIYMCSLLLFVVLHTINHTRKWNRKYHHSRQKLPSNPSSICFNYNFNFFFFGSQLLKIWLFPHRKWHCQRTRERKLSNVTLPEVFAQSWKISSWITNCKY